jgi:pimeloyl-ACP methyl ester carboxylesterase
VQAVAADGVTRFESVGNTLETARLTMRRGSDTLVTVLRRALPIADVASAIGDWSGVVGQGFATRLGIHIERGPCGLLVGVLDSPDQGQTGLPFTGVHVSADSIAIEAEYLELRVSLPRNGGDERTAVMAQRDAPTRVTLRRGVRVTESRRSQDPIAPFPYDEREARYASHAEGIRLTGTLTLPRSPGRHPAVIFISGSGAQDRNETVAGHRPFLVLADFLTRRGFAVLRVDDRGAGGSNGNVLDASIDDLAQDVRGGIDYLRAVSEVDPARIGVLGHSEGGYVAQLVAASDPSIAFVLLLAAPTVRGREVLTAQRAALARAAGDPPVERLVDSLLIDRIFAVIEMRPVDADLSRLVDSTITRWAASLSAEQRSVARKMMARRSARADSESVALWQSAWFKSLFHHDPRPQLERLDMPVFAAYGELDLQVPASQSAPALERAFAGARRDRLTVVRLPRVNHLLQTATTGRIEEYAEIGETIAAGVFDALDRWIGRLMNR